jgi:hypothetical protein
MSLDPEDWMRVSAARAYRTLGDAARAGGLAEDALPSIRERLAHLTGDGFGEGDLYWTESLVDCWCLVGQAARASGDVARAERYLAAAWRVGFSPPAGWALGEIREKQGRLAEAAELWSMATSVPTTPRQLPADWRDRLESASRKVAAGGPSRPGGARLTDLRMVRLAGSAAAALTEEVLLLVGADGRVEHVSPLSGKPSESLQSQLGKLGPIRLDRSRPDGEPFKVVQRALLTCSTASGCVLILDLPGMGRLPAKETGSIGIVSLEPEDGSSVVSGGRVTVKATVRYELRGDSGTITLVVQDQAGKALLEVQPSREVTARSGEITLEGAFTVPRDATRIELFLPLSSGQGADTSTVAVASYRVESP